MRSRERYFRKGSGRPLIVFCERDDAMEIAEKVIVKMKDVRDILLRRITCKADSSWLMAQYREIRLTIVSMHSRCTGCVSLTLDKAFTSAT